MEIFKSLFVKQQKYKIILLSALSSGKTCILYRLILNQFLQHSVPTIGFNVQTYKLNEQKNTKIQIWDVCSNFHMVKLWKHYYQGLNGVIYVIDPINLKNSQQWYNLEMNTFKKVNQDLDYGISLIIFFNKIDIYQPEDYKLAQKIANQMTLIIQNKRPYKFVYTSAKVNGGIKQGIKDLLMLMRLKRNSCK